MDKSVFPIDIPHHVSTALLVKVALRNPSGKLPAWLDMSISCELLKRRLAERREVAYADK